MRPGRMVWVEEPDPKPISAARWVPLAKKHKLNICWNTACVVAPANTEPYVVEFWGGSFPERDVGACVLKVVAQIEAGAMRPPEAA